MEQTKYNKAGPAPKYMAGPRAPLTAGPFWFPMLLVLFALILASGTVRAHGGSGYYQIVGMEMGDYTIHVWTSPGLLRTGEVHVDTAVFDAAGMPAFDTLIMVTFTAVDGHMPPTTAMASLPYELYPYTREARFQIDTPGVYTMDVMVADRTGMVGNATVDVRVQTITTSVKAVIVGLGLLSLAVGIWLVLHMRSFWHAGRSQTDPRATIQGLAHKPNGPEWDAPHMTKTMYTQSPPHGIAPKPYRKIKGRTRPTALTAHTVAPVAIGETRIVAMASEKESTPMLSSWYARLNGLHHARALWIFMLIVVAHWMEHVLQIYQIYGLGWAPTAAGGLIGVFFPILITSETLHFVYDFIQWAGIVVLRGGFRGPARPYWRVAMIAQTWHFIEHILLMVQYLTGYYIFGRIKQTSLLELFFPREELHFVYNLIVFVPMVIAVHYYLRPKVSIDRTATSTAPTAQT
ncbi:MAG: hypothetical protein WDZ49_08440 [Litorilinea sp.]